MLCNWCAGQHSFLPGQGSTALHPRRERYTMSATSLCSLVSPSLLVLPVGVLIVLKLQFLVSNWSRTFGHSPERRVFPFPWVYLSMVFRGIGLPGRALRFCICLLWYCVWLRHFTGFLEYVAMVVLKFARAPGPSGDRGDMPLMATWGLMAGHAACCTQYTRCCPFGPCTGAVHGAPGHNRWGVVETPLPVKTQGGTMNCFFLTSAIKYCCRVAFNCRF